MNIIIHPTAPKYVNKKGNTVFRYLVTGTKEEIEAYKAAKAEHFADKKCAIDEASGHPLFFSMRYTGKKGTLRETNKDNKKDFVVEDTEIVMFQSLVSQYGIDVAKVIWEKDNQKVAEVPVEIEGKK